MLNIIKNNKGMSLPIILAISSFFIISVFILTTVVLYQAKAREADFNYQQEYSLAQSKINATVNAIVNNDDLSTDFLNDLSNFLDVEITQYDSSTIMISSDLTSGRLVKSYLSKNSEAISTTDEYFENTGFEDDFELNPLITPASLLNSYLDQYFEENFDGVSYVGGFTDIDSIVEYIGELADKSEGFTKIKAKVLTKSKNPTVNGYWYIDGNLKMRDKRNLTIPEGYILVINGDLKMGEKSTLKGNVIVNGDVTIDGNWRKYETVKATIYLSGSFYGSYRMNLGDEDRPTFIFSEKKIEFDDRTYGTAYLLADEVEGYSYWSWWGAESTTIDGGVYSDDKTDIIAYDSDLDESKLYDYGVAASIESSSGGEGGFLFTNPE